MTGVCGNSEPQHEAAPIFHAVKKATVMRDRDAKTGFPECVPPKRMAAQLSRWLYPAGCIPLAVSRWLYPAGCSPLAVARWL